MVRKQNKREFQQRTRAMYDEQMMGVMQRRADHVREQEVSEGVVL